jgi:holliday junction DNA helicase RuvA
MYAFIEGEINELNPAGIVLACNGIGYNINITLNTYSKLNGQKTCRLYTHLIVREDALTLYGFIDTYERTVFQQLISVSGVGPNTGRLILSSLTADEVVEAIQTENVRSLQSIKGIGTKSAQRIIIDLKGKMSKEAVSGEFLSAAHNTNKAEALSALIMLGFNKATAEKAIDGIMKSAGMQVPVEQLVKLALKAL